jgi:hypothetical protein
MYILNIFVRILGMEYSRKKVSPAGPGCCKNRHDRDTWEAVLMALKFLRDDAGPTYIPGHSGKDCCQICSLDEVWLSQALKEAGRFLGKERARTLP